VSLLLAATFSGLNKHTLLLLNLSFLLFITNLKYFIIQAPGHFIDATTFIVTTRRIIWLNCDTQDKSHSTEQHSANHWMPLCWVSHFLTVMLNVAMLSVVMVNDVLPFYRRERRHERDQKQNGVQSKILESLSFS